MTEIDVTDQNAATVHVGDTLVLRLAETPSTGFTWTIDVTGTAIELASDTRTANPDPRPGAPGQRVFVLNATAPGHADVSATLARPWEPVSVSETRHLHVAVQP
jgi:inhibitor of cysteine peptidase